MGTDAYGGSAGPTRVTAFDTKEEIGHIYKLLLAPEYSAAEGDYYSLRSRRMEGSCGWLVGKPWFLEWRQCAGSRPPILWLQGSPGAGKSIIAIGTKLKGVCRIMSE